MKKLCAIIVMASFAVAALFLGATFWFGMETERVYGEMLKDVSRAGSLGFNDQGYNRGFFSSTARTLLTVNTPAMGPGEKEEATELTLVHEIRHGPWPPSLLVEGERQLKPVYAFVETKIERPLETKDKAEEILDEFPELIASRSYTTLYLGGRGEMQIVIPPLRRTTVGGEPATVDWSGLNGQMWFTADLKEFKGSFSAPGLTAVKENGRVEINGVTSAFDLRASVDGPFLGEASFDLGHLESVETQDGKRRFFSAKGMRAKGSSWASGEMINSEVVMTIEQVLTDDRTYGPGDLTLELRKLDAPSLGKLGRSVRELQAQSPQVSPDEVRKMILAKFGQIMPGLMKHSPEFEISLLALNTSDGELQGKAKIIFHGDNALALSNPLFLLSAVTAHVEFAIADRLLEEIVESANREMIKGEKNEDRRRLSDEEIEALASAGRRERLEALVENNVLIHDDGDYRAMADFENGQLTLNGRPLMFQDLVQR